MIPLRCLALILLASCLLTSSGRAEETAGELQQAHRDLVARYAAQTGRPADPAHGELLFVAANQYRPVPQRTDEVSSAERRYATELFALAQRAAESGYASVALQWVTEVVRCDPNHAAARRILGYEQHAGQWLTPLARKMADRKKAWHPQFGWIGVHDLFRYERGERRVGNQWVIAEVDARRHQTIETGWRIRTDHFLVTTNHSLEAGAELATRLEGLYQVWRQLFAAFDLSKREVRQLFAGDRNPPQRSKPFHVIYYRNRQQYVEALRHRQPQIGKTLGIYFDTLGEAHFYAGQNNGLSEAPGGQSSRLQTLPAHAPATLYHEAVHQLFHESRKAARHVGQVANFWVIEGVATYFESLAEHVDSAGHPYYTIGTASAGRLPAAVERAVIDQVYLPLADFTRFGKLDLQRNPDIHQLYSQSAGLATFLMHAREGAYREPFVQYLLDVYAGRDSSGSLAAATGQTSAELDRQYFEFLQSTGR
jgi:hypothetical protein